MVCGRSSYSSFNPLLAEETAVSRESSKLVANSRVMYRIKTTRIDRHRHQREIQIGRVVSDSSGLNRYRVHRDGSLRSIA
jgi:hypothetical protein